MPWGWFGKEHEMGVPKTSVQRSVGLPSQVRGPVFSWWWFGLWSPVIVTDSGLEMQWLPTKQQQRIGKYCLSFIFFPGYESTGDIGEVHVHEVYGRPHIGAYLF